MFQFVDHSVGVILNGNLVNPIMNAVENPWTEETNTRLRQIGRISPKLKLRRSIQAQLAASDATLVGGLRGRIGMRAPDHHD